MPPPTDEEVEEDIVKAKALCSEHGIILMKDGDNFHGVKKIGPEDRPYQAIVKEKGKLTSSNKVLGNFISPEMAAFEYARHEGSKLS